MHAQSKRNYIFLPINHKTLMCVENLLLYLRNRKVFYHKFQRDKKKNAESRSQTNWSHILAAQIEYYLLLFKKKKGWILMTMKLKGKYSYNKMQNQKQN